MIACPPFVAQEMANPTNIDARSRFDTFQNQWWCAVHNMYAATIWCVWWLWSCCAFSTVFYFVAFNIIFFTRWNLSDTEYKIDLEIHTTALVSSRSSICMAAWKIWCFLLMQVLLQSIFAHIVCCLILFFRLYFFWFFSSSFHAFSTYQFEEIIFLERYNLLVDCSDLVYVCACVSGAFFRYPSAHQNAFNNLNTKTPTFRRNHCYDSI